MKKIFTLIFAVTLFSAGAFAQERRHHDDNSHNNSYNNNWNRGNNDDHFDGDHKFSRREWSRHRRFESRDGDGMFFRRRGYYDNYHRDYDQHGRRFSLNILIGKRDRY